MYSTKRAYFELHFAVFLWGITAIIGDLISLTALVLVWWRVLITSLTLLPFISLKTLFSNEKRKMVLIFIGNGLILGIHWLTFFGTIKLANASICLVCMSATPFFTAILEAFINARKIKKDEILLGLIIIPAMFVIAYNADAKFHLGFLVGIFSSIFSSLNVIYNKKYVGNLTPQIMTFIQMFSAWALLSLMLPVALYYAPGDPFIPTTLEDISLLLVLAVLCTTVTFLLALRALERLSAFAATLSIALEPVYGIVIAAFFLGDYTELNNSFYVGAAVILLAVITDAVLKNRPSQKKL